MTQPINLPYVSENGTLRQMTEAEYEVFTASISNLKVPGPSAVTMRQARLALLKANKLSQVQNIIAGLPSPQKEEAQIEWEYATQVERTSTLTSLLGSALGMSEEEIDELFVTASTL